MENRTFTEFVEEVRVRADIVEVVGSYLELRRTGINHKGCCPFHKEKTPSFMVNSKKQFFHCFGCHAGGDVVTFVMKIENLDFRSAVEFLAKKYNIQIPVFSSRDHDKKEDQYRESLYELMQFATEFFQSRLKTESGKTALDYLLKRGFSQNTIERFSLGYSEDSWDALMTAAAKKGFSQKALNDTGMILTKNDGGGYDRFRGRVIFPIKDILGRTVGFGGRILDKGEPKYLNSPETIIYKKSQILYNLNLAKEVIKDNKRLLLTEGYVDAITVSEYGFPNVVASLGTALTEQQANILKRYAEEVIFIYDGDEAGQKSMIRGIEILQKTDIKIKVVVIPDGMDPDEFLRNRGRDEFQKMLDNAMDFFEFLLQAAGKKYDMNTVDGKVKIIEMVAPILLSVQNLIFRSHYQGRLSDYLRLEKSLVEQYLATFANASQNRPAEVQEIIKETGLSKIPQREKNALKFILEYPEFRTRKDIDLEFFSNPFIKKWFNLLIGNPQIDTNISELSKYSDNDNEYVLLREIMLSELVAFNPESDFKQLLHNLKKDKLMRENERSLIDEYIMKHSKDFHAKSEDRLGINNKDKK